jgi:hypothetical protein
VLWSATSAQASMRYPAGGPQLLPGCWYSVRVVAGRESSDDEPGDVGFQLLPPRVAEQVATQERALSALELGNAEPLLHGLLLRHFELRSEALAWFASQPSAELAFELGNTRARMGLIEAAARAWARARDASERGTLIFERAAFLLRAFGVSSQRATGEEPGGG